MPGEVAGPDTGIVLLDGAVEVSDEAVIPSVEVAPLLSPFNVVIASMLVVAVVTPGVVTDDREETASLVDVVVVSVIVVPVDTTS